MSEVNKLTHLVAVIGAGPAGMYASQYLAQHGIQVVLFNRDIKPGGLAEYGIFPDKQKMRAGLMSHFRRILAMPQIRYRGNVTVGQSGDIRLDQLRQVGFQAIMVTTGAQQHHWLGLPGEDLAGVFQANDIVFHYNRLPAYAENEFKIGQNVAVIGVGNVMLDILHYLKKDKIPRIVTAHARRGPTEVKFDQQTLEPVAECLDMAFIKAAVDSAHREVKKVNKDKHHFYSLLEKAKSKADDCQSGLTFRIAFLRSPRRLMGDKHGQVKEIIFERNHLRLAGDEVVAEGTGELESVAVDTVIFSIGSRVDTSFGLPVAHGNFVTSPQPRYPVDGISYEVYNPDLCAKCEDVFVSGWARQASEGIVGLARKDAERGAKALLNYLQTLGGMSFDQAESAIWQLPKLDKRIVDEADLKKLTKVEQIIATEKGLPWFKFSSDEEMLRVIDEGD